MIQMHQFMMLTLICPVAEEILKKCSNILNNFLFLFPYKMLVIRTGIHKMLVRIANKEVPDQTASSEAVRSGSALFV